MSNTEHVGVMDAITGRHSVRAFTEEPVSTEQLDALFQAARLAPSSLNSQPWRYKAVVDKDMLQLFATKDVSRTQTWLAQAGAIIVCCADTSGYVRDSQASAFYYRENDLITGDSMDGIEDYVERESSAAASAQFGAAAMNVGISISFMMLRAIELGLGTCWVGMFNEQKIKEMLNIDSGLRIVGLLAVGHPASDEVVEHNRKSLDEIILS
ncbi:nitroreductase family protein [Pseudodesulfovibrio sediminis]|uniref:Nitroreductase n=1 Tax=Pseudodesulfovibrio sediminis TaxID=2810563 RepID=A0ABM7P2U5_9BACT|nr:nitroreductase family protein [Pseudodesulfovibrio sediminis]BCS87117.1 nitroreductase [Pseudodesulfovibrio sediminis]